VQLHAMSIRGLDGMGVAVLTTASDGNIRELVSHGRKRLNAALATRRSWRSSQANQEGVMKLTPVGIDIAKHVFQVHHIDEETGNREQADQAGEVSRVLRQPRTLPDRHGSVWRCASLGKAAHQDGPSGKTDARGIREGV
jgi:hypothetical protein